MEHNFIEGTQLKLCNETIALETKVIPHFLLAPKVRILAENLAFWEYTFLVCCENAEFAFISTHHRRSDSNQYFIARERNLILGSNMKRFVNAFKCSITSITQHTLRKRAPAWNKFWEKMIFMQVANVLTCKGISLEIQKLLLPVNNLSIKRLHFSCRHLQYWTKN